MTARKPAFSQRAPSSGASPRWSVTSRRSSFLTHTSRSPRSTQGNGFWYFSAWFPQPVHSVRVECIARSQQARFRRLCAEAMGSLEFH